MSSRSIRCCECLEISKSETELLNHLSVDHLRWMPFQCFYCLISTPTVSTHKVTQMDMRSHVEMAHPGKEFKFVQSIDEKIQTKLDNMIQRSLKSNDSHVAEVIITSPVCEQKPFAIANSVDRTPEINEISRNLATIQSVDRAEKSWASDFCNLCDKPLKGRMSTNKTDHVTRCHFGKMIYRCPFCDFSRSWNKYQVKFHITTVHHSNNKPIDDRYKFEEEIERLKLECFGKRRTRSMRL